MGEVSDPPAGFLLPVHQPLGVAEHEVALVVSQLKLTELLLDIGGTLEPNLPVSCPSTFKSTVAKGEKLEYGLKPG